MDSRQQAHERRTVQRIERSALMAAGKNAAVHRAGVVIELHFQERSAHERRLAFTSLRPRRESRRHGYPSEETEAEHPDRDRHADLAAEQEKHSQQQSSAAADGAQDARGLFG